MEVVLISKISSVSTSCYLYAVSFYLYYLYKVYAIQYDATAL